MATKVMTWDEAILKVLKENNRVMHYREIATAIVDGRLRPENKVGSTPAITVNNYLRGKKLKDKVGPAGNKGEYALVNSLSSGSKTNLTTLNKDDTPEDVLITSYGRFWDRKLFEENKNLIYGTSVQTKNSAVVSFSNCSGIYLLHKGYEVIYVGQAKELAKRVADHLNDDKRNRWDNFSWFSITPLKDNELPEDSPKKNLSHKSLLDTLEALLIETLGPERNKKVGNDFEDKEFEQITELEYLKRNIQNQTKILLNNSQSSADSKVQKTTNKNDNNKSKIKSIK